MPAGENFCMCFVTRSSEHFFVSSVLCSDSAHFGRDGIISIHNQHQRAEENPHCVIHFGHQQESSINVYTGIVVD
jgi:hypothetical protein